MRLWQGVYSDVKLGATTIQIVHQELAGRIPAALSGLPELRTLHLRSAGLRGPIPPELGGLPQLRELWLSSNHLSGFIPGELGNLANLRVLSLAHNTLSGGIPSTLGNLRSLYLYVNYLSGPIPAELGKLANLEGLGLETNALSGVIPRVLGDLTELTEISMGQNQLTGQIPSELGSLVNLEYLNLGENRLTGPIPAELGGLSSLTVLHLHNNQLSGSIPVMLGNLSQVDSLDLSCNRLSGRIPSELADLPLLVRLSLQGNMLDLRPGHVPEAFDETKETPSGEWIILTGSCWSGTRPAPSPFKVDLVGALTGPVWPISVGDTIDYALTAINRGGVDLTGVGWRTSPELDVALRPVGQGTLRSGTVATVTGSLAVTADHLPGPLIITAYLDSDQTAEDVVSSLVVPIKAPPNRAVGATGAARAMELPGDRLLIERLDQPGASIELAIGSISADGRTVGIGGVVRDETLGQTYIIVRRQSDGRIVRRWVPPDSPLVAQIPWAIVNVRYTVPVGVVAVVPLDDQLPESNQLVRRFEGNDDRIFAYDADARQWRHVPDVATFQGLGFYWCNVNAADAAFFARITPGPPYPTSQTPARSDYRNCQTS